MTVAGGAEVLSAYGDPCSPATPTATSRSRCCARRRSTGGSRSRSWPSAPSWSTPPARATTSPPRPPASSAAAPAPAEEAVRAPRAVLELHARGALADRPAEPLLGGVRQRQARPARGRAARAGGRDRGQGGVRLGRGDRAGGRARRASRAAARCRARSCKVEGAAAGRRAGDPDPPPRRSAGRSASAASRGSSTSSRRAPAAGPSGSTSRANDMLGAMSQGPVLFAYDGSAHAKAAIERAGAVLQHGPAVVATAWTSFEDAAPAALLALPGDMVREGDADARRGGRETAEELAAEGAELARAAGFDAEPRAVRSKGPFFAALIDPPTSSTRARSWPAAAAARRWPPPCWAASRPACSTTRAGRCMIVARRRVSLPDEIRARGGVASPPARGTSASPRTRSSRTRPRCPPSRRPRPTSRARASRTAPPSA